MNPNEVKEHTDPLDRLIVDYPSVFKDMDHNTAYGLPSGWYVLVDKLCSDLAVLLDEEHKNVQENPLEPLFTVLQVKEKFGGLRFYYRVNTENEKLYHEIGKLVDKAEETSYKTCEITGKPGTRCSSGMYYHTFCEEIRIANHFNLVENGNT